jgi:hypothetical protein
LGDLIFIIKEIVLEEKNGNIDYDKLILSDNLSRNLDEYVLLFFIIKIVLI